MVDDAHTLPALPTLRDVKAAACRIRDVCIETPLLESPHLNQQLGGRLLLKSESLQVTGSFKLRGAANRVASLTDDERRRGVVARSSGNHGLAIAYCAGLMGTSAVVVVPDTAPAAKIEPIAADDFWVVAGAGTVGLEIAAQDSTPRSMPCSRPAPAAASPRVSCSA